MLLCILYQGYYERFPFSLLHVDLTRTPAKPPFELHYTYKAVLGVLQHFLILILPQRFQVTSSSEVTLNTAHMTTTHLWVLPLSLFSLLCDCYGNAERRLGDYLSFKRPNPAQDAKFLPQNASLFLFHSRLLFINFLNIHNIDAELVHFPLLFLHFVKYSESGCN